MKNILLILAAFALAGCAGTHPKGVSRIDEFDAIQIDQMVGNNISSAPMQKVIVCLNARRETRQVTALTNISLHPVTNTLVQAVTNETISISTNYLVTTMTNLMPAIPGPGGPVTDEAAAAAVATVSDAPSAVAVTNAGPALSTNLTTSLALNSSASAGPAQRAANRQVVRTYNNQITTTSNNLSIAMMTNLVVTAETNLVVSYVTNHVIASLTNVTITPTNLAVHDYFLYTEMIPPPDFSLATSGESLILLVDGVRHGLSAAQSGTAFIARKGFSSAIYRVPPGLLVDIANAKEVRVRLKGASSVVERTMNERSRRNFKTYLVRFFAPQPDDGDLAAPATAGVAPARATPESIVTLR